MPMESPNALIQFLISTQHDPGISQEDLRAAIIKEVIMPTLPAELIDDDLKIFCQSHRTFCHWWPHG